MSEQPVPILLVEDSRTAARILLGMLQGDHAGLEPYDVVHATSLEEAGIALATDGPFQAVVLDLTLPDSDGLDTYRVVREAAPDTAVVILTGNEDATNALEAVDLGAQDYVVKGQLVPAALHRSIDYAITRQAARAEVARALRAADEANARLQDWVGLASHELLSPIASIDALAGLLATSWDQFDEATRIDQTRRIHRAAQRLSRTGVHFLQTVRADATELQPEPKRLEVAPLVHDLVDDLQYTQVTVSVPDGVAVRADQMHVETILSNLLRNAVRHGDGPVRLEVDASEDLVEFRVADLGDGVAPHEAGMIFQRYARGTTSAVGTGLGLYVARRMARANGGDLWLDPSYSAGARFILTVPTASAAPASPADARSVAEAA